LGGFREINEKREILQTEVWKKEKKGCFQSHFSDS
jgi:hypothetical protein